MPNGLVCEASDNDAIDRLLRLSGIQVPGRLIDKLESKLRYVIIAVVITSTIVWGVISYGVPVLAKHVAFMIPVTANTALGDTEKKDLRVLFSKLIETVSPEYQFSLEFRHGRNIGPNAFALPTGTIIVTDEMVQMIDDRHELESILAHEIGHVVYRHSLRKLIQSSTVALVIMAVTGDISTVSVLAGSLPTILTETYYSREFEREADEYSYEYLTKNGISPTHFANILGRIADSGTEIGFLSTHPSIDQRVLMFSEQ
jgi:hypothetical protein